MGIESKKNEKINNNNNKAGQNKRRRKKRRTEDFSSDSESSSSSSSEEEEEIEPVNENIEANNSDEDIEIDSDDESKPKITFETLNNNVYEELSKIKLSAPSQVDANNKSGMHTKDSKNTLVKDRVQLNTEYLKLMSSNFGDDLDELRKKPDFTDKSLVILAKSLQSGANMFDEETLNVLFNN